jgi:hypothetical protein
VNSRVMNVLITLFGLLFLVCIPPGIALWGLAALFRALQPRRASALALILVVASIATRFILPETLGSHAVMWNRLIPIAGPILVGIALVWGRTKDPSKDTSEPPAL